MAQEEHKRIASGVYWVDQTSSTQQLALAAQADFVHGDVFATDNQTAGRGRMDRTWVTPPGTSAAMSLILQPRLESHMLGVLTLVVADGLVRWFRKLGIDADVKWPNDIQGPDGRKLSGILAQWVPEANAVVIGIGTNLDFGELGSLDTAAALADYGVKYSATDFVIEARQKLLDAVTEFVADPNAKRLESTMSTVGQRVKAIMPDGKDIVGTAVGLGTKGSLLVQDDIVHEIFAADIIHLRAV